MQITYGSVCSGIEAASVAWEPLGFTPAWFAEIEPFPVAVLEHHWPNVPNLGDMTTIAASVRAGSVSAPMVLVGGTPCQAFSVAGARAGLADPRGRLTISYVENLNAIDQQRIAAGEEPAIGVWENVPGVLSDKGNAFGAFLGLLAGEDCELQPPGGKWKNAGFVSGPQRTIAWRILDAQYFGVAQRRRRVFVVASARKDFDPRKVLFESEGVRRDTAPSRGTGSSVAALTANGVGTCGADDNQAQAGHIVAAFGGGNRSGAIEVAACLTARGQRIDFEVETFIAQSVTGDITHTLKAEGFDGSEDGTGRGTPIVNTFSSTGQGTWAEGCGTLRAREQESHEHLAVMAFPEYMSGTQCASAEDISPSLMSLNPTAVAIAFNSKDHGQDAAVEISPTLRASGSKDSHANAGAPPAVVLAFAENSRAEVRFEGGDGQIAGALSVGGGKVGQGYPAVVAFQERGRSGGRALEVNGDLAYALTAPNGGGRAQERNICDFRTMSVRRLTPVECERLQGFSDNHTLIPGKKMNKLIEDELVYIREHFPDLTDAEAHRMAADGPRYKGVGNSMAVPVMAWIGKRIKYQLEGTV